MLRPGDSIDIWVVEAALGSGGMGSVYRCHNRDAPRILAAIKVLEWTGTDGTQARARFVREAEILFLVDHPNIVKVRNVRTDAQPPYLEMEFVEGESLEEQLQRGPIPASVGLDLVRQAADAVGYLHARGIRHRDLKPANLVVQRDGTVKVVDFGLAVDAEAVRLTADGTSFGTVSYAPPEWATPERLDPAKWDVYALGVVLYEVLTGRVAFPASGEGTVRQQAVQIIVSKQGHPPLDPGDRFPDDLRALVRDLTASDPTRRIADGGDLVARLARLDPTRAVTDPVDLPLDRDSMPPVARRSWVSPWAGWAAVGGVGAAVAGILAVGIVAPAVAAVWWSSGTAPTPPTVRDLVVVIADLPDEVAAEVLADGRRAVRDGPRFTVPMVPPGSVEVAWTLGGDCSAGSCGSATVEVPAGDASPWVQAVSAVLPSPRTTPTPRPDPARPAPVDPVPTPNLPLVTVGSLGAWVDQHPDWAPNGRLAGGDAYLPWWTHRTASAPATGFTPRLADAYCTDRSRQLPSLEAEPHRPADGGFELRLDQNRYVVIEGVEGGRVRKFPVGANAVVTGAAVFRCAE